MSKHDIDKAYVSPYDKFLYGFDLKNEKTASQLKEIKKHKDLANLRDNASPSVLSEEIWEDF